MIKSIQNTSIIGVKIIEIKKYDDNRGNFIESFLKNKKISEFSHEYVQENESVSKKFVFRGLHFQKGKYSQSKLIRVINGSIFDIMVDLRRSSKSFKKIFTIKLEKRNLLLFVPKGIAHGFLSLEDNTIVNYKCDQFYSPGNESGLNILKNNFNINWPLNKNKFIISKKDRLLSHFKDCYIFD